MYTREEQLDIFARIGITKEAYDVLRKEKRRNQITFARIVSELIINKCGNNEKT